jgi:hypothetical protein
MHVVISELVIEYGNLIVYKNYYDYTNQYVEEMMYRLNGEPMFKDVKLRNMSNVSDIL